MKVPESKSSVELSFPGVKRQESKKATGRIGQGGKETGSESSTERIGQGAKKLGTIAIIFAGSRDSSVPVPKCPHQSDGAEMSWVRSVLTPQRPSVNMPL